ncbi:ATP-binding protein [Roseburia sp. MSJ-14]|uniref:ATP-binding protein n=1 Tax=Roseburia sp. MSJ-14 TaxID=2841514 RepID=UPI001C10D7D0|nr:SbcC/MukB-like Walker B domain-containing protein [Roseburia sp. MSJ-14]MBU5472569.1 AAA family ATPase [Roseburia sp. MSJ-14]
MENSKNKDRFEALSRMCLNNWHYIERKVLSFHKEINFFTGHSGSGKSTIIDALQIVLYANTDGRGFFNKAAAEDSDRSLIEYLRGMINIEDNNENAYLRNRDFSSTIVLELERSDTGEKQCVGIVFDVETATNEISRYFFWHRGPLLKNHYRMEKRVMSTEEVKEYLTRKFDKSEYFVTSRNETFRRKLYDDYLGGLDMEKFPMLFKRAIPFKMNSRLEDFVKEYICMEQDIHIEDMQESVIQYGRMQKKIMDTAEEINRLQEISDAYKEVTQKRKEIEKYEYFTKKLEILRGREEITELEDKIQLHKKDLETLKEQIQVWEQERREINQQKEELIRLIAETGYEEAKDQLKNVNELLERLERSKAEWDKTAAGLKEWADNDMASNAILWDVEKFCKYEIEKEELETLKRSIQELREEVIEEREEIVTKVKELRKSYKEVTVELSELHKGSKAYPREVVEARQFLFQTLSEKNGKAVKVSVLADLLDIAEERWRNAVEGYMGSNKLLLIVEPKYAKQAMELYQQMDKKKFSRVAVLDTEKVLETEHRVKTGALAEAVKTKEDYVKSYIAFLLGNVIKCNSIEEMREHAIGITDDCMLYQGYKLQHMNPNNYTKFAYIGAESLKRRISMLKKQRVEIEKKQMPLEEELQKLDKLLAMEALEKEVSHYTDWLSDIGRISKQKKEKERLERRIMELQQKDVAGLKLQKEEVEGKLQKKEEAIRNARAGEVRQTDQIANEERNYIQVNQEVVLLERELKVNNDLENELSHILENEKRKRLQQLRNEYAVSKEKSVEKEEELFQKLAEVRSDYLRKYPNRGFGALSKDNAQYEKLLEELQFNDLERFQQLAKEQAKSAIEHFKDDFMFKIRSAIKDAMTRKDELNKIIAKLDFGKDKYQFVFNRNNGEDGKYYDMFMDEDLDINPAQLNDNMDNQMNMFTMKHEDKYGDLINELMSIFIPPVDATPEEQEEAKRNMDKYADYRTYLSFDMQQIIKGDDGQSMKLKLSKMLRKNSGGEGQNPLYVALLASFAQAYRITMNTKYLRTPTIRLVVLDEAFSKMDGEKVASCISLIRSLGFQVIISATNDKIQNYLENVDKTFVFANPNKKSISIQEFEKKDFEQLEEESLD